MNLRQKFRDLKVKVEDSEGVAKASSIAKAGTIIALDGCGFCAWMVGRVTSPLTKKLKKTWEGYQSEKNSE